MAFMSTAQAAPLTSHFPSKDLGRFLAEKFDLASIRSSFGPRRLPAQRTFADFGMKPTTATDRGVVFDTPGDWFYALEVVGGGATSTATVSRTWRYASPTAPRMAEATTRRQACSLPAMRTTRTLWR